MRGDAGQAANIRIQKTSIFLPISPLKIITTVSGSAASKCLGNRIGLIWFVSFASRFFPRSYFILKLVPGTLNSTQ